MKDWQTRPDSNLHYKGRTDTASQQTVARKTALRGGQRDCYTIKGPWVKSIWNAHEYKVSLLKSGIKTTRPPPLRSWGYCLRQDNKYWVKTEHRWIEKLLCLLTKINIFSGLQLLSIMPWKMGYSLIWGMNLPRRRRRGLWRQMRFQRLGHLLLQRWRSWLECQLKRSFICLISVPRG